MKAHLMKPALGHGTESRGDLDTKDIGCEQLQPAFALLGRHGQHGGKHGGRGVDDAL